MRRLILMLKALALTLTGGYAQLPIPQIDTHPDNNTLLWEVSGGGLQSPSYFLGTMHILCPEDAWLSASVKEILGGVKAIYLEMDLDNMVAMMGAMRAMTMRNDTTLADLLTEEELTAVQAYFADKLPLPFAMLKRYKPMLLAGMMAEQMLPCKAGSGTESLLMAEAKKRKLSIEGLETPAFQAGLFDSIPYRQQAQELIKAINDTGEENSDAAERMLNAYSRQDLQALDELTKSEEGGMAGYLDLLLYGRNRTWAEKFVKIAESAPHLFAVGAGHLPGEEGVLNLLRQKGYQLRPLANGKPSE
ncbi:MAG TPA: TraB/GumN family protein [Phnomibacter sp.]|nr:TraB/GumN family protein [Phnomibacter sp.]